MKKDKEWLKKDIKKVSNDYPTYHDKRDDLIKKMVDTHEVLKLIDRLDEPEITEEQALNKLAESYPFSADGINAILQAQLAGYSPVSTMKFIQSNEPELPAIPQFVADFIKGRTVSECFYYSYIMPNECNQETYEWINDNQTETARAILDGYTIEKEKRYRVKLPDVESESYNNLLGLRRTGDDRIVICKIKLSTFLHSDNVCFTEQEIKRNHEYLWQFAEEVIDK